MAKTETFTCIHTHNFASPIHPCRYVFSSDVARALYDVHSIAPLKFMPNEDATFGFWVMGMDLEHVDHPKVRV